MWSLEGLDTLLVPGDLLSLVSVPLMSCSTSVVRTTDFVCEIALEPSNTVKIGKTRRNTRNGVCLGWWPRLVKGSQFSDQSVRIGRLMHSWWQPSMGAARSGSPYFQIS